MSSSIVKQGYILKKSVSAEGWSKRYLVLTTAGDLSYYNTEEDFLSQKTPKTTLNIPSLFKIPKMKIKVESLPNHQLKIVVKRSHELVIDCITDEDATEFEEILRDLIPKSKKIAK